MRPSRISPLIILLAVAVALLTATDSLAHYMALVLKEMRVIPIDGLADETEGADIVFVGEKHDVREHHEAQLEVIKALKDSGRSVALGLEMFRADRQPALDKWVGGEMAHEDFRELYSEYWGLPWDLYSDIFHYSREQGIPMIGLNVPKEITDKVAKKGFAALTKEDLKKLPIGISCDVDESYMEYIRKALEAHGKSDKSFIRFCEAQLMWDKVMAWYIVDYLDRNPGTTVVVLAGKSHAWKKGIPEQVKKQSDLSYKVILPLRPNPSDELLSTEYVDYLLN
jgi:uncharacterized iron-regulated protein